jgi:site-specific DNA-methyltransferase (cytosine-N4-specific)
VTVRYEIGDTRDVVATLADGSVSLVACSPPFIALRSYLPADHPDKHAEIGSEPDPATFLDTLLALTAEWGRVLAPWGSIAIELGDTYAGGSAQGTDQGGTTRYPSGRGQDGLISAHTKSCGEWPRAKSLALIPQLYAASLAYGRNLLTGQPSPAGQWLVRNVIVWHRPNPAVGAPGDKVRPSTSYITVATRSAKRWFDLDAVRTPGVNMHQNPATRGRQQGGPTAPATASAPCSSAGAPPLDCWFDEWDASHDTWTLTTQPSSLAHYAMWPARLAERLILMMCPAQVCAACGTPRRRLTSATYTAHGNVEQQHTEARVIAATAGLGVFGTAQSMANGRATKHVATLGWSDCGHDDYRAGTVLDPFAGTGTTLAVADLHDRNAIGIDIDERNRVLYSRRRDECARALFDVRPQLDGQLDMFAEVLL